MRANTDIEPTAKSLATDRVDINALSVAFSSLPNNRTFGSVKRDIPQVSLGNTASGNRRQSQTPYAPRQNCAVKPDNQSGLTLHIRMAACAPSARVPSWLTGRAKSHTLPPIPAHPPGVSAFSLPYVSSPGPTELACCDTTGDLPWLENPWFSPSFFAFRLSRPELRRKKCFPLERYCTARWTNPISPPRPRKLAIRSCVI